MKSFLLCLLLVFAVSCSDNPVEPEVPAAVRDAGGVWLLRLNSPDTVWTIGVKTFADDKPYGVQTGIGTYSGDSYYIISYASADSIFAHRFLENWGSENISMRLVTRDSLVGRIESFQNGIDEVYSYVNFRGVRKR